MSAYIVKIRPEMAELWLGEEDWYACSTEHMHHSEAEPAHGFVMEMLRLHLSD